MEVIWKTHPIATDDIVAALAGRQTWQEATIKTLLNRLLNKGAVGAVREGRRYLYSPLLTREDWISSEAENLLERLFGGRVAPLVAHFGKHRKLSKRDLADIKRLIEQLDHE